MARKIKCIAPPQDAENHNDSVSNKPLDDSLVGSIIGQSEDFENKSGASKENSTIAEENVDRASSFVIDSNRKYSFMSTPRQDGKGRSNSFEHCYSMPNLDSSTPPDKIGLIEETKEIVWSYENKEASPKEEWRKSSIDEEGLLERERIKEQQQQLLQVEGVVSKNASVLKPTINVIETSPSPSQQNVTEENKDRSRANSNVQASDAKLVQKNSPGLGSPKLNETITDISTNATESHDGQRLSVRKGSALDIDKYLTREFPKFSGDM